MALYYYISFLVVVMLLGILIRFLFLKKKSIPVKLFLIALRRENSGEFEAALRDYETALEEETRARFPDCKLKNKISEKLKVLHTVVNYQNSLKMRIHLS
ncbi:MAG: hypothetical protein WBC06_12175 [Chitinophagaceae bacterium]